MCTCLDSICAFVLELWTNHDASKGAEIRETVNMHRKDTDLGFKTIGITSHRVIALFLQPNESTGKGVCFDRQTRRIFISRKVGRLDSPSRAV